MTLREGGIATDAMTTLTIGDRKRIQKALREERRRIDKLEEKRRVSVEQCRALEKQLGIIFVEARIDVIPQDVWATQFEGILTAPELLSLRLTCKSYYSQYATAYHNKMKAYRKKNGHDDNREKKYFYLPLREELCVSYMHVPLPPLPLPSTKSNLCAVTPPPLQRRLAQTIQVEQHQRQCFRCQGMGHDSTQCLLPCRKCKNRGHTESRCTGQLK